MGAGNLGFDDDFLATMLGDFLDESQGYLTNLNENLVTLGYQIDFGKGATFSRRHSQGVFDGY